MDMSKSGKSLKIPLH